MIQVKVDEELLAFIKTINGDNPAHWYLPDIGEYLYRPLIREDWKFLKSSRLFYRYERDKVLTEWLKENRPEIFI